MSRYVKDCKCSVAGCVVNNTWLKAQPLDGEAVLVCVSFQPVPSCPKCHKPWRLEVAK